MNESDTVIIVTDMLAEVLGYEKYSEISSEHAIRGTFCDLALKLDGALAFLVEVKAIGMTLKDAHIKQAVDYAANQGVDWVVLTNGIIWRIYKVGFGKPITHGLVVEVNILELNPRLDAHIELAFLLEGRLEAVTARGIPAAEGGAQPLLRGSAAPERADARDAPP